MLSKNYGKKLFSVAMAAAMVLSAFTGCNANPPEKPNMSDSVEHNENTHGNIKPDVKPEPSGSTQPDINPDPSEPLQPDVKPEPSEPLQPDVKPEPSEPAKPDVEPEPSEPAKPDVEPEPSVPVKPEPPQPTEPEVKPETPKPEPPAPTEPDAKPEPPKPEHQHRYTDKVVAPTCTEKGYTLHTCTCGHSYKDSYKDALGHSFTKYKSNNDATCTKDGTKTASCNHPGCKATNTVTDTGSARGHEYQLFYSTSATLTHGPQDLFVCIICNHHHLETYGEPYTLEEYQEEVAKATLKYINKYRVEQGVPPAISLPGLQKVAQLRAVQLQKNYAHSVDDLRAALAYYKYGDWVDLSPWGGDQYYSINGPEAIYRNRCGEVSVDAMGESIARTFRNSPPHWSYLGSAEYRFMSIGVTFDKNALDGYDWKVCTLQTDTNYG